ncbi:zinc finger BED domain-containing protein 1-like [Rhagoletis pomonella]|uniref:zinc finger BED domain-containing protein 1-like n=1 Tax=Rhagoletis pomonella TaxID=28610 RepID=UPI00177DDC57|nr:zinc finger BED domain-containing protein 1-like [Rhagoletis pomonella]
MSRKKSEIWLHFSEEKESSVQCRYCDKKLAVGNKSTFNLIRHMNAKHPTQVIHRQEAPGEPTPNNTSGSEVRNVQGTQTSSVSAVAPPCPSVLQFLNKPLTIKKQAEIDAQVVAMIVREYHPFSVVEDAEFKKLVNLLNPSYKPPTRKTISSSLIPAIYRETVEKVKQRLTRAYAVCLTMDGWTSRAQDGFISVTAHYIAEENNRLCLASDLLTCTYYSERHTGDNITNKLREILEEWDLSIKVTAIVTDNAANMKAAVRGGGWRHWGCFAHTLNLVAQSGLKEIQISLDKVKAIVRLFRKSSYAKSQLNVTTSRMQLPISKLINDVPTRWNSTYEMLKRIMLIKEAVIATVAVVKSSALVRDEGLCNIDLLSNEEWLVVEETIKIMEIFDIITKAISGEKYVSVSTIILYVKQLEKHLNSFKFDQLTPPGQKLVKKLLRELNERFKELEKNELIAQATILDPRFKKFGFISEVFYKAAVEKLYFKVSNIHLQSDSNTNNNEEQVQQSPLENASVDLLWKDFDAEVRMHTCPRNQFTSAVLEVDKYLGEPILPRKTLQGKNNDPLFWWCQRKHIYPRLFQIVKTRLCISATSVPCERIFSHAGQIVSERRERLDTSKISQVVFLNYNLGHDDS